MHFTKGKINFFFTHTKTISRTLCWMQQLHNKRFQMLSGRKTHHSVVTGLQVKVMSSNKNGRAVEELRDMANDKTELMHAQTGIRLR